MNKIGPITGQTRGRVAAPGNPLRFPSLLQRGHFFNPGENQVLKGALDRAWEQVGLLTNQRELKGLLSIEAALLTTVGQPNDLKQLSLSRYKLLSLSGRENSRDYADLLIGIADAHALIGQHKESEEALRRVLMEDKGHWQARVNLAIAQGLQGKFAAAEQDFALAREIRPAFAAAFGIDQEAAELAEAYEWILLVRNGENNDPQQIGALLATVLSTPRKIQAWTIEEIVKALWKKGDWRLVGGSLARCLTEQKPSGPLPRLVTNFVTQLAFSKEQVNLSELHQLFASADPELAGQVVNLYVGEKIKSLYSDTYSLAVGPEAAKQSKALLKDLQKSGLALKRSGKELLALAKELEERNRLLTELETNYRLLDEIKTSGDPSRRISTLAASYQKMAASAPAEIAELIADHGQELVALSGRFLREPANQEAGALLARQLLRLPQHRQEIVALATELLTDPNFTEPTAKKISAILTAHTRKSNTPAMLAKIRQGVYDFPGTVGEEALFDLFFVDLRALPGIEDFYFSAVSSPLPPAALRANWYVWLATQLPAAKKLPLIALAAKLDPQSAYIILNRALALSALNKPAESEKELDRLASLPSTAAARYLVAQIRLSNRAALVAAGYRRSQQVGDQSSLAEEARKIFQEAEEDYQQLQGLKIIAADVRQQKARMLEYLGHIASYLNELERAIEHYDQALVLDPEEEGLVSSKVCNLIALGRLEEASSFLNGLIVKLHQATAFSSLLSQRKTPATIPNYLFFYLAYTSRTPKGTFETIRYLEKKVPAEPELDDRLAFAFTQALSWGRVHRWARLDLLGQEHRPGLGLTSKADEQLEMTAIAEREMAKAVQLMKELLPQIKGKEPVTVKRNRGFLALAEGELALARKERREFSRLMQEAITLFSANFSNAHFEMESRFVLTHGLSLLARGDEMMELFVQAAEEGALLMKKFPLFPEGYQVAVAPLLVSGREEEALKALGWLLEKGALASDNIGNLIRWSADNPQAAELLAEVRRRGETDPELKKLIAAAESLLANRA